VWRDHRSLYIIRNKYIQLSVTVCRSGRRNGAADFENRLRDPDQSVIVPAKAAAFRWVSVTFYVLGRLSYW
jgi:hypothetical protein